MKPVYFDLTVHDVGEARKFFEAVFGWQFERFPMPYEYYRIQAGPESEPGIDGGTGALKDVPIAGGMPTTLLTVPVPNLDAAIAKIQRSGSGRAQDTDSRHRLVCHLRGARRSSFRHD